MGLIRTKNPKSVLEARKHKGIGNHADHLRFSDSSTKWPDPLIDSIEDIMLRRCEGVFRASTNLEEARSDATTERWWSRIPSPVENLGPLLGDDLDEPSDPVEFTTFAEVGHRFEHERHTSMIKTFKSSAQRSVIEDVGGGSAPYQLRISCLELEGPVEDHQRRPTLV